MIQLLTPQGDVVEELCAGTRLCNRVFHLLQVSSYIATEGLCVCSPAVVCVSFQDTTYNGASDLCEAAPLNWMGLALSCLCYKYGSLFYYLSFRLPLLCAQNAVTEGKSLA